MIRPDYYKYIYIFPLLPMKMIIMRDYNVALLYLTGNFSMACGNFVLAKDRMDKGESF